MKKLERAIVVASNNHRQDLSDAAAAVLEFLPHHSTLAVIFAEIYGLTPEVIQEIKEIFNVGPNPNNN